MIRNQQELEASQERIAKFQSWLLDMRQTTSSKEFVLMSSGYRLEIEKMQAEVLEYLLSPALTISDAA
ncbi:MAG: hypothetical protein ACRCYY_02350 [Trueperaceae bacterium]